MDLEKTRELFFSVPGDIVTKNTGKIVKIGGFNKIIQPKESLNYSDFIKFTFKQRYPSCVCCDSAVRIDFKAYFYPTKQIIKTKWKRDAIKGDSYPYCKKPDIDRILNQINDALKSVAFRDDTLIWCGSHEKYYSVNPRLDVFLTFYDNLKLI